MKAAVKTTVKYNDGTKMVFAQPSKVKDKVFEPGMKVVFKASVYGDYYDNYSGYRDGMVYGTIIKVFKVNALIEIKSGSQFTMPLEKLTDIEDLF